MNDERMERNEKAGQVVASHHGFDIVVCDKETVYGIPMFDVVNPATGETAGYWYPTMRIAKACCTKLAKGQKAHFDYTERVTR